MYEYSDRKCEQLSMPYATFIYILIVGRVLKVSVQYKYTDKIKSQCLYLCLYICRQVSDVVEEGEIRVLVYREKIFEALAVITLES